MRDLGVRISLITRIFGAVDDAGPGAGHRAGLRRRRLPRRSRATLTTGTLLALATLLLRLLGPLQGLSNVRIDVMTALVSFERVFEVLDLPSSIQEKPDAVVLPADRRRGWSSTTSRSATRAPTRSRWPRLEAVARKESRDTGEVLQRHLVRRRARPDGGPGRARPAPARPRSPTWSPGCTTSTSGAVRVGGHDVRDVTLESLEDAVGYVTQDAHMFHDTIRANLLYARPGADDRDDLGRARGGADRAGWSRSLPDGLDTVVGDRGYRLSGGERQRLAIARLLLKAPADRGARRGDRPPRLRVRVGRAARARRGARGPHLAWSSRTGSPRSATPTRSSSSTTAGSCSAAPTPALLAEGGLYADLYRTQFIDDLPVTAAT